MPTEIKKVNFIAEVYHKLRTLGYKPEEAQEMVDLLKKRMKELDINR